MSVHDLNCLPDKKCPLRGCWALQRPIACLRQKIAAQPSGPTFRRAFHNSDGLLANVEPGTVILTDDYPSYVNLSRLGYTHDPKTVGLMAAHVVLPWVHRVFALLKRWGLGIYHGLRRKHVQS